MNESKIQNADTLLKEEWGFYTGKAKSLEIAQFAWFSETGKPGPEWNTMEITLDGPRTIVYLNGVKVTDFKEGDPVPEKKFDFEPQRGPRPEEGYMGIQYHGDKDIVFFKEVSVKLLKESLK